MKKSRVTIVNTGVANIASIKACLERFDVSYEIAMDAASIESANAVILPGVGSFESGMRSLEIANFVAPLKARLAEGRPMLAICLGLQLLYAKSEESPGVRGLEIFPYEITRFTDEVRIPHFGWNSVGESYAYFANSYRAKVAPKGWEVTWCDYGGPFVAMLKKSGVLATQFHPELSGTFGNTLVSSWLKEAKC